MTYNIEGCTEDTRRNKHREEQKKEHKNTEEPERRRTREKPKKTEAELKKGALTTNNVASSSVSVTNDCA